MPGPITLDGSSAFGFVTENGKMATSGGAGPVSLAGDATGPSGSNTVERIQGQPVEPGSPSSGDQLLWDGSQWARQPAPSSQTYGGWQDFAHGGAGQSITDIEGGSIKLANDGTGFGTSSAYTPSGVADIWSPASDTFEMSELSQGDTVSARLDVSVAPSVVPARLSLELRFFSGPAGSGSLVFTAPAREVEVTTGAGSAKRIVPEISWYVGAGIAAGSCEVHLVSSAACAVTVQGWFCQIDLHG